ncbi:hypothetical protein FRC00_011996, partial [Tulasnella sp. 408]
YHGRKSSPSSTSAGSTCSAALPTCRSASSPPSCSKISPRGSKRRSSRLTSSSEIWTRTI